MSNGLFRTLEDLMVAVTFAEKNDAEFAMWVLNSDTRQRKQQSSRDRINQQPEDRPQMRM